MTSPLTTEARNYASIDWVGVLRTLKQEARGFFTHIEDPAVRNPRAAAYVAEVLVRDGKIVKWPTGFAGGIHTHENPPGLQGDLRSRLPVRVLPPWSTRPLRGTGPRQALLHRQHAQLDGGAPPLREAAGGRPFITVLPEGVGTETMLGNLLSQVSDVLIVGGKIVRSRWPGRDGHEIGSEWARHDEHVYGEPCSPYYFTRWEPPWSSPRKAHNDRTSDTRDGCARSGVGRVCRAHPRMARERTRCIDLAFARLRRAWATAHTATLQVGSPIGDLPRPRYVPNPDHWAWEGWLVRMLGRGIYRIRTANMGPNGQVLWQYFCSEPDDAGEQWSAERLPLGRAAIAAAAANGCWPGGAE